MDNMKTGALIKALRKEKDMTQKELAAVLHITDKAVSKWERGLCAPDIALLEPLAQALGCSVLELIAGEREAPAGPSREGEQGAKKALDYSQDEIRRKVRLARKRYLGLALAGSCLILAVCALICWRSGYFFIIDKKLSPDETRSVTVYDKALSGRSFSGEDGVSLITELGQGGQWRVTYGDCRYLGMWWSPDSQKYVLALEYADGVRLGLSWLEWNSHSNLSAYLTMGVQATELSKYGYVDHANGWPDIEYEFLQWSRDSRSMLIYYSFADEAEAMHEGYFWYDCLDSTVSALLEMEPD